MLTTKALIQRPEVQLIGRIGDVRMNGRSMSFLFFVSVVGFLESRFSIG